MYTYDRTVQYYETDKMGVTHHANYIHWMEEARVVMLESIGLGYDRLEEMGIVSPVTGISCDYKHSTTFQDKVRVALRVISYDGVKLVVGYEMTKLGTGEVALTGTSSHLFLDRAGHFLRMKRQFPEVDQTLRDLVEGE